MYVISRFSPYNGLAKGILKDTRYAKNHYFALREVADVLNKISGYTVTADYNKSENTAKLIIDRGTQGKKIYRVSIGSMSYGCGYWQDGHEVSVNGVYFTYYQCPLNSKTYINVEDLARELGLIIIAENQNDRARLSGPKSYVLGAEAFLQLGWRVNVSVGICWDGTGDVGLLGGVSFGGGLKGVGIGAFLGIYNTSSINNLSGLSMEVGGGTAIPGATISFCGLSWGVDKSYALSSPSFSGTIYSVSGGIGWPVDVHGQMTLTGVINVSDGFRNIMRIILGNTDNADKVLFNARSF